MIIDQDSDYKIGYPPPPAQKLEINEPDKKVELYEEPNQLLKLTENNKDSGIIIFQNIKNENRPAEIMRLDKDGMVYKGKRIEDAGEVHQIFLEVMALMKLNYQEQIKPKGDIK